MPPVGTVVYERQQGNGWVPYTPGTWSQTIVRARLTCTDTESGIPDVLANQQILFNNSTVEAFLPSESPFSPCEDRAGNVDDLTGLPSADIMVDLANPACVAKPTNVQIPPSGGNVLVEFELELSDNLALNGVSLVNATNSEGSDSAANAGSWVLAGANPDTDTFARHDSTLEPRASKQGLQRVYRYTFEVADESGRTGECLFTVKVK